MGWGTAQHTVSAPIGFTIIQDSLKYSAASFQKDLEAVDLWIPAKTHPPEANADK